MEVDKVSMTFIVARVPLKEWVQNYFKRHVIDSFEIFCDPHTMKILLKSFDTFQAQDCMYFTLE
jgi:hypothetical protein